MNVSYSDFATRHRVIAIVFAILHKRSFWLPIDKTKPKR
jgi:hypothetical protein